VTETIIWEAGRDTLALSNPEWFRKYCACVLQVSPPRNSCYPCRSCARTWTNCIQVYVRGGNFGGLLVQMLIYRVCQRYLHSGRTESDTVLEKRNHGNFLPSWICKRRLLLPQREHARTKPSQFDHLADETYVKGSRPFEEMVHMAIDLVNTYAHAIMDFEAQAWNSTLQKHLHDCWERLWLLC